MGASQAQTISRSIPCTRRYDLEEHGDKLVGIGDPRCPATFGLCRRPSAAAQVIEFRQCSSLENSKASQTKSTAARSQIRQLLPEDTIASSQDRSSNR